MTRRLDWESANKRSLPPYDPRPGQEISETSAREDQEFLAEDAASKKKRTKYVRSSARERAIGKLMEAPESRQERRLKTVLAVLSYGKSLFELRPADDASHRLFQRKDVKLRVKIDPTMRRQLIALSPGEPESFDWITVNVAAGALEDPYADCLAGQLRELILKQQSLRQRLNA